VLSLLNYINILVSPADLRCFIAKKEYKAIPLADFKADVPIYVLNTKLSKNNLVSFVNKTWIEKQTDQLPEKFTAELLCEDLKLRYVLCWVISADVTASWSAKYVEYHDESKRVRDKCRTCRGSGYYGTRPCHSCDGAGSTSRYITKRREEWHKTSGDFSDIVNDISPSLKHYSIKTELPYSAIAKPDIKIGEAQRNSKKVQNLPILKPIITKSASAKEDFETGLPDKVTGNKGYSSIKLRNKEINFTKHYVCLCPIYTGTYRWKRKNKAIEVNAITGQIVVDDTPKIRKKVPRSWSSIIIDAIFSIPKLIGFIFQMGCWLIGIILLLFICIAIYGWANGL